MPGGGPALAQPQCIAAHRGPDPSRTSSRASQRVDLALGVLWNERSKEELEDRAARYASLGIPAYVVFDRRRRRLRGFRLVQGSACYQPIARQEGRLTSAVLGLDLGLEGDRLRSYHALARLQEPHEVLARLGTTVDDLARRSQRHFSRSEVASGEVERPPQRAANTTRVVDAVHVSIPRDS
ncbi:Uma2 family endonuclease [Sorangium sp. So ce176]|uniref:Uma2 family endonuclease n=1 Tax=Sorangium sp. So ce176 TaxID=3133286 RepID=UPI003F6062B9